MALPPAHRTALAELARRLRDAREPWWVIAGTAVALHGGAPMVVDDIDVLVGGADAGAIATMPGVRRIDAAPDDRFRSDFYAETVIGGVRVELMAGFRVFAMGRWHAVEPRSRTAIDIDGERIFVPARDELVAMLRLFGRAKDHARIALLTG